jgi:hypothetical protein
MVWPAGGSCRSIDAALERRERLESTCPSASREPRRYGPRQQPRFANCDDHDKAPWQSRVHAGTNFLMSSSCSRVSSGAVTGERASFLRFSPAVRGTRRAIRARTPVVLLAHQRPRPREKALVFESCGAPGPARGGDSETGRDGPAQLLVRSPII